jgi:pheromone shutdown protein TraB
MPRLQRPLIDERDRFLMSAIREAPGRCVVGVVGAGHVGGMVKYLNAEVDRQALSQIPAPSWLGRLAPWLIPVAAVALFYRAYVTAASELGSMLLVWALANAALVGAFTLAARAKPLTLLLAALAAPIVALIPRLGAGTVAALVEAWQRRPGVADSEGLSQVSSLADWLENRFTRVLLVSLAATVGGALGALLGIVLVLLWA